MHHTEIISAAPDAIAAAFGMPNRAPHPQASTLRDAPLSKLAYAIGMAARAPAPYEKEPAVMGRGMSTPDFSRLLAGGANALAVRTFNATGVHRVFCGEMEAKDFRPVSIGTVDSNLFIPVAPLASGTAAWNIDLHKYVTIDEIKEGVINTSVAGTAQLTTHACILNFSRQLVKNDDVGIVKNVVQQMGGAAANLEAAYVYHAMEQNPTMDDGAPVFHADFGNVVAEAFGESSLGTAMKALRLQALASGNRADLKSAHLVVSSDLELAAYKLNHQCGLGLTITATYRLPAGRWFLLADPEVYPSVSILKLQGTTNSTRIEEHNHFGKFDGVSLRIVTDVGAVMHDRVGIVRGGV
jgi:hypothetical protein